MARDQYESIDGRGHLQDRYGRDQFVLVEKHQAPTSTDVQRGYEWSDEDGRKQLVLLSGETGVNLLDTELSQAVRVADYFVAGHADHTIAWGTALDAAALLGVAGSRATVMAPEGLSETSTELDVPDGVTVTRHPRGSIVRAKAGSSISVFSSTGGSDIQIRDLVIDGNKANVSGGNGINFVAVSNVAISGVVVLDAFNVGILIDADGSTRSENVRVAECVVFDPGGHGIALSGTSGDGTVSGPKGVRVSSCLVRNPGASGINVSQASDCQIVDNRITQTSPTLTGYAGLRFSNGASHNLADGNLVDGMDRGYFIVADAGAGDGPCQYNNFGTNTARNCLRAAMLCESPHNNLGTLRVLDCAQDAAYSASDGAAIRVSSASWVQIDGNSAVIDTTGTKHRTSVSITGTSDNCDVGDGITIKGYITQPISVVGVNTRVGKVNTDATINRTAAAALSLRDWTDTFVIDGATTIASISTLRKRIVQFIFSSTAQMTDGSNLKLAGNFTGAADRTITLYCDGTNYIELSRSAN